MQLLPEKAIKDAQGYALKQAPRVAGGVVVAGSFIPVSNIALDPLVEYLMSPDELRDITVFNVIEAVLFSRLDGFVFPDKSAMVDQVLLDVPFGLIPVIDGKTHNPIFWGDQVEIPPLVGRPFVHGVTDCFSIIRDTFRLGRRKLEEQGIFDWPYDPVYLPAFPRQDGWWDQGENLYLDNFRAMGFFEIPRQQARVGDGFLISIASKALSHAGLLIGEGEVLHHRPLRPSNVDRTNIYFHGAAVWLRWGGQQ